jgi:hypothetical protein
MELQMEKALLILGKSFMPPYLSIPTLHGTAASVPFYTSSVSIFKVGRPSFFAPPLTTP